MEYPLLWAFGGIMTVVFAVLNFLMSRTIKEHDDKVKKIDDHIANTDLLLQKMRDEYYSEISVLRKEHNELNLDFVNKINSIKDEIINKIGALALIIEGLKK